MIEENDFVVIVNEFYGFRVGELVRVIFKQYMTSPYFGYMYYVSNDDGIGKQRWVPEKAVRSIE